MSFIETNIVQGVPEIPYSMSASPTIASAFSMTASVNATAFICPVKKTGTLSKIHFRLNASNTSNDYSIRVETINADGDPSNSLVGANTEVQTGTGISAGEYVATLNAGAVFNTINTGFAIVFRPSTFVGASAISMYSDGTAGDMMPYYASSTNYTGGSWIARAGAPMIGLEYSDGSFVSYPGNWPFTAFNSTAITTASNPRLAGNVINLPFTVRAIGLWFTGDNDSDFQIILYDSDGVTALATINVDADFPIGTNAATTIVQYFQSNVTIEKDKNYYLIVKSSSGTITLYDGQMITNVPLSTINGGLLAKRCYTSVSTPTSPSDFTIDTNKQSYIGLLYDAVDYNAENSFAFVN